ncbi:MAG: hypothetical protein R3300_05155 [Candidatus Promineifilaceae bacterium]|nr:hypothetical protein [Candidatus Promineifilaceae bacterium]
MPENPFIIDRPLRAGDPYVGREKIMAWVGEFLASGNGRRLALVQGSRGFGKSSLVAKLAERPADSEHILLTVDVRSLPHESESTLLWSLTKAFSSSLLGQGISPPPIEKALLLLNPRRNFQTKYWLPLVQSVGERALVVIIDNADEHLRPTKLLQGPSLFEFIPALLSSSQQEKYLFTTSVRVTAFPSTAFEPFGDFEVRRMSAFSSKQVRQLLRHMPATFIPNAVSNYIYTLTEGHPADVQRLAHALYERCTAHNVGTATTADLIAILAYDTEPLDFHGPVYRRRRQLSVDVKSLQEKD